MPDFHDPQQHPHLEDERRRMAEEDREEADLEDLDFGSPSDFDPDSEPSEYDSDDLFGEVVYSYTRAQALADGNLLDASALATGSPQLRAALTRFKIPVAVTPGAIAYLVQTRSEETALAALAELMTVGAALARFSSGDRLTLDCYEHGELWLHIGPGDRGEPVFTVMTPGDA